MGSLKVCGLMKVLAKNGLENIVMVNVPLIKGQKFKENPLSTHVYVTNYYVKYREAGMYCLRVVMAWIMITKMLVKHLFLYIFSKDIIAQKLGLWYIMILNCLV